MANLLIEKETNRVITCSDNSIVITEKHVEANNRIYATLNDTNSYVVSGVEPPTRDNNRYTYDGEFFTDTWPFKSVSRIYFIEMLETNAGLTDDLLVQARNDNNLSPFWVKFEFADGIERDHNYTVNGLDALVSTGYISKDGKQAVLDNWPRGR